MAVTVNALFKKSAPAPAKTVKKTVRSVFFSFLLCKRVNKNVHSLTPARINLFFLYTGPGEEGGPGEESSGEESPGDGQEDGQEGRSGQVDGENRGLVQVVR